MAKKLFPRFGRDHRTGSLQELSPGAQQGAAAGRNLADPFRVLVANEDELDRQLMIRQLGQAGPAERDLMVECAANGAEALAKLRSQRYGFVVLEWILPDQVGAEVLRAIRDHSLRVPVVVVSGQPRAAIACHLDAMAAAFVNKQEMNAISFRCAIVSAILLLEGAFGLVRSGYDIVQA